MRFCLSCNKSLLKRSKFCKECKLTQVYVPSDQGTKPFVRTRYGDNKRRLHKKK